MSDQIGPFHINFRGKYRWYIQGVKTKADNGMLFNTERYLIICTIVIDVNTKLNSLWFKVPTLMCCCN